MSPSPLSQETVLDALQTLIRTPSINPTLAPDEGTGEAAVVEAGRGWLAARGVAAQAEEVLPGRPNLVAEVGSASAGPTLVLCAHIDTVAVTGMTIPPFEPRVSDGRVYGRGSYDMKGGAAAILCALAALRQEEIPGRVMAALVMDEEYASLGAQDFVSRYPADACIVTEPSEERLVLAHKGFVWVEIAVSGKAAHGSRFDLGVSAIGKIGRIIVALERFDQEVLRKRSHPLTGPASLHCAQVEGGVGLSTYAERSVLKVERRTIPGETPEQVMAEIAAVIREAGEEADLVNLLSRPPLDCDRNSKIARSVREAAQAVQGAEPEEAGVAYWMDAAIFAAAGIPTVDFGPAGAGAHEAVEWVDLGSVVRCAQVLTEGARRFLKESR